VSNVSGNPVTERRFPLLRGCRPRPPQGKWSKQDRTTEQAEYRKPCRRAAGPPATSSMMPAPQAPKPTVVCSAIVAPLFGTVALIAMPEVSAPESAGTAKA